MPTQQAAFFEEHKHKIWTIRVDSVEENPDSPLICSGLAVDDNLILTTAECIWEPGHSCVALRDGDEYGLDFVLANRRWNCTLLQFKEPPSDFIPANIGTDYRVGALETLFRIGHLFTRHLLCTQVESNYPSPENVSLPSVFGTSRCGDFSCHPFRLLAHRILGNFLNDKTKDLQTAESNYEPYLPAIQITGMNGDGFLFKKNGDVVGMMFRNNRVFKFATHVAALRAFVEDGKRKIAKRNRKKMIRDKEAEERRERGGDITGCAEEEMDSSNKQCSDDVIGGGCGEGA